MSLDQTGESKDKIDVESKVFVDTQYPAEKLVFRWRISNFSKIFNTIETDISTVSKATLWRFRLKPPNGYNHGQISMVRAFEGQPVKVDFHVSMKTLEDIHENSGALVFNKIFDECRVLVLRPVQLFKDKFGGINGQALKFENDVLNFQCTMTIVGHCITRKLVSPNLLQASSEKINRDLENLFLSNQHCDVTLTDGEKKISAHKAILCARSPVFNVMFQQNMQENTHNVIQVDDIDFEILQDFVSFLYSGKVKVSSSEVAMILYYAADKYEVQDLRDICTEFLLLHLTVNDACDVLKLADQHKDDILRAGVVFFIQMHVSAVKLTKGWEDLVLTCPKILEDFL